MKLKIPVALVFALLSACSTTLKPVALDPGTGRFPTDSLLPADGVRVQKEFVPAYKALLYVKTDETSEQYRTFFMTGFGNMNVFTAVKDKSGIETLVIQQNLADKVSNVSDLVGLNNLQKQIGPFLVVEPKTEWTGGYNFSATLKAIDPRTGETVLDLYNKAFNWAGLDEPLFFPLLNGFLSWTQGQPIAVEPLKEQKPN